MNLNSVLYEKFKLTAFRLGQKEIITDVLNNNDVLAMLPTGSGKSLCYQLPAYLLEGITIVVSPLLSLMEDQVQQLKSQGLREVAALNSFLSFKERENVLKNLHKQKIIYVSPEILQSKILQTKLKRLAISLLVVDEAHCISQWGHEFRTDYLRLNEVREKLGKPPCLALTATATNEVQQDIIDKLKLVNAKKHIYSVDRPNISFYVKNSSHVVSEKISELVYLIKNLKGPGIIYASTRNWTEELATILSKEGIKGVAYYHGGMNNEDRLLIQQQFINNQLQLICCTSAFGMGINKPNIRYVIHFHSPLQLESYLQEIGRAGRDGAESIAISLFSDQERSMHIQLLTQEFPSEEQLRLVVDFLHETKSYEKINEPLMFMRSGITEVMWRFIRFHLEEHGVIVDNKIKQSINKQKIIKVIIDKIEIRTKYKQSKFIEFQKWLFDVSQCKRKTLLAKFEETSNVKPQKCCHVCGFNIEDYYSQKVDVDLRENLSWENELKKIFHQS